MQEVALETVEALAARVTDGAMVAVPPDYSFVAMAATRALIRRGARDLHLLAVPQSGIQADMLIGAGCVAIVETAAVSLGELGAAPQFTAALKLGNIAMRDSTCPAIHAGLQASEKGLPFMPLRGLIGSDLMRVREDWKESENPFEQGDRITVLPALKPDVALFHAPFADANGNVWIGRRRELVTMAHAARATLVTVEEIRDIDLMRDEALAGGSIPALYVTAIAEAPNGAWPLGLAGHYEADQAHLAGYAKRARSPQGFADYLAEHGA
ncbi:MAG: CoA-transferase [Alphaproteobacteria bacterium]|nr:CoA-transferase [Alphaproteobacteria bacterium]